MGQATWGHKKTGLRLKIGRYLQAIIEIFVILKWWGLRLVSFYGRFTPNISQFEKGIMTVVWRMAATLWLIGLFPTHEKIGPSRIFL